MRRATRRSPASGRRRRFAAAAVFVFAALTASCSDAADPGVRPPAVAGSFYPDDPAMLRRAIRFFLDDAAKGPVDAPRVLVAPHAGYLYSGQIAADAWAQAAGEEVETIFLLGTNHTVRPFDGASVWYAGAFRTPLGDAAVDEAAARRLLAADPRFRFLPEPHGKEHSVEVQVPFAQVLFPDAKIVPVVVGSSDPELCRALGAALAEAAGPRSIIVASSDLSHYPDYDDAVEVDGRTLRSVASLDPAAVRASIGDAMRRGAPNLSTCACGEGPVLAALEAARRLGLARAAVVSYANSGDTPAGDPKRVVGYGAVVIGTGEGPPSLAGLERPAPAGREEALTDDERRWLLDHAHRAIAQYLTTRTAPLARPDDPALWDDRGAFVTLQIGHRLRGCIGHMEGNRPLGQVVGAMALQAAFNDRRFPPLGAAELPEVSVEISVLTPRRPVTGPDEIVVGRDGVYMEKDGRSAVFLPQVAPGQGWDRETMLAELSAKAGLAEDAWKRGASFWTFQAEVFGDKEDDR